MKRLYVFLLVWGFAVAPVLGQLEQTLRLEIKTNPNGQEKYEVVPLGKDGVLLTVKKEEYFGDAAETWTFINYNADLKEAWRTTLNLDFGYRAVRYYQTKGFLYWLFMETETDNIQVLKMELATGETDVTKGKTLTQLDVQHFKLLGNTAYLGGSYHGRPLVVAFSLFDRSVKVLPGLYANNAEINNLEIDEANQRVNVVVYTFKKSKCQFEIKTYSKESKLLKNNRLSNERNSLISGRIIPIEGEGALLVGNYSQGCTQYSQGLYFSKLDDQETTKIQYVEFSELENFFNYLKPKHKQRMLERIVKKKEIGKEIKLRYRMLVHNVIKTNDEYVLVAEVFYPQYRISNNMNDMGVSNARTFNVKNGDGYRYTHALVCGFDGNGKLLWDNCFGIQDLSSNDLMEMVQVSQQGNALVLAYPQDGEIHTEVIERNKVVKEPENFKIKTNSDSEKVLYNEDAMLTAWYDRYFLAYGIQKIVSERGGAGGREVFYLNKISYKIQDINPKN